MDRWIRTAWRAFWVGLGASAVLIGQSVLAVPTPDLSVPAAPALVSPPAQVSPPAPAAARIKSADPALLRLSRTSVDSSATPLSRCEVIANGRSCS